MRLNRSTDIGLRILMLGTVSEGLLTVDRLAESLQVPRHHLAKVVQRLQRLGLIDTVRGRGGGVRLSPSAAGASIGSVVRDLEGDGEVVECAGCPLSAGCRLRCALRRAQESFYAALDPFTVGDMSQPPTREVLLDLA